MQRSFAWLLGAGFVASAALHAGILLVLWWHLRDGTYDAAEAQIPIALVATPELRPTPPPPPSPIHPVPRVSAPKAPHSIPATRRQGIAPERAPRVIPAPANDPTPTPSADASTALALASFDAGVPPDAAPIALEPLDLRPAVPGAARFVLVVHTNRLRGTAWATALESLLAPLPDHRALLAGLPMPVADLFDTLLVSSPDLRNLATTFLAARPFADLAAVRAALAAPASPGGPPRVTWNTALPFVGERAPHARVSPNDTRVFVIPTPEWVVLVPRAHLPELLPHVEPVLTPALPGDPRAHALPDAGSAAPWQVRLALLECELGRSSPVAVPVAVMSAADLGIDEISLPGLPRLPAPLRLSVSISQTSDGFTVAGALAFASPEMAQTFARDASTLREAALTGTATRFFLQRFHVLGALASLTLQTQGAHVGWVTRMDAADAAAFLTDAAAWTRRFFAPRDMPAGQPSLSPKIPQVFPN